MLRLFFPFPYLIRTFVCSFYVTPCFLAVYTNPSSLSSQAGSKLGKRIRAACTAARDFSQAADESTFCSLHFSPFWGRAAAVGKISQHVKRQQSGEAVKRASPPEEWCNGPLGFISSIMVCQGLGLFSFKNSYV